MTVMRFQTIADLSAYLTAEGIAPADIVHLSFESVHSNSIYLVHT